jgi:hypothetical protein
MSEKPIIFYDDEKEAASDVRLQKAISLEFVPKGCLLGGELLLYLIFSERDPCGGCHYDKKKCGGRRI